MHSVEIILLDSIFAAYDKCYVKYFKRNNITNKNTVTKFNFTKVYLTAAAKA